MRPLDQYINEGLFGVFRAQAQITKVQGSIIDYAEKLINDNPDKYKSGSDVLRDCEGEASKLYKQYVTEPEALKFNQWWSDFKKSASRMLDRMMKQ